MNRLARSRFSLTAVLALGTLGVASLAQARSDVYFPLNAQGPGGYAQQMPIHAQPAPIHAQPYPFYIHPHPAHGQP